jgi:hypothetical protein
MRLGSTLAGSASGCCSQRQAKGCGQPRAQGLAPAWRVRLLSVGAAQHKRAACPAQHTGPPTNLMVGITMSSWSASAMAAVRSGARAIGAAGHEAAAGTCVRVSCAASSLLLLLLGTQCLSTLLQV